MSTARSKIGGLLCGGLFCAGLFVSPGVVWAQFPDTVDLAVDTADVTILEAEQLDKTGFGLTSGDYDGDGLTDFAVFSSEWVQLGSRCFIHILWGSAGLDPTIDLLTCQGKMVGMTSCLGSPMRPVIHPTEKSM